MGKRRNKMPISERAKQFNPFAAVSGLEKALAEEEREFEKSERIELSEESAAELNEVLMRLKKGDKVTARYYRNGEYVDVDGAITLLDRIERVLKIGENEIKFDDLYKIKL